MSSSTQVKVYFWGTKGPLVLLLAGVHGDETGPIDFFTNMVKHGIFFNDDNKFRLAIIPCANPCGYYAANRYDCEGKDINRSWLILNSDLKYWVDQADIIYDFHEAHRTWKQNDLGRSIYTTHPEYCVMIVKKITTELNLLRPNLIDKWTYMSQVTNYGGKTLDEYCIKNNKLYILIEFLRSDSLENKAEDLQTIIHGLFEKTVLFL